MYINPVVSNDKLLTMLKRVKEAKTDLHQFAMYHNGEKLVEFAIYPYTTSDKRRVNSVSKTFVSTAVGLCYDRGWLKPEDKLISFFPEEITKNADEKIKKLTLHEMLTMTTGVEDVITLLTQSDDPIRTYFTHEFKEISKDFQYNNSATFMLSAVVTQLSGYTVLDFLKKNVFSVLGITNVSWPSIHGITEGCAGLRVSADDIARHMQIYLGKGMYQGKRILSEEWVNMASSYHISTEGAGLKWWENGYGYQIWLDKPEGFRASGALGQYGHVFPSINAVLGIESRVGVHDPTQDAYYDFCSDFKGESTVTLQELEEYMNSLYLPSDGDVSAFTGFDKMYNLDTNDIGITLLSLKHNDNVVECEFSEGEHVQTMRFGIGHWEENKIFTHNFRPELCYLTLQRREIVHFDASCKLDDNNNLEVILRFRDCAFCYKMTISADDKIQISFDTTAEYLTPGAVSLSGTKL